MSYGRVHGDTLRFYVDTLGWLYSRGMSKNTEFTDRNTGDWSYNTGHDKYKVLDLNPMIPCSYNTTADQDGHIMHQIDMTVTGSNPISFFAILGHNADSAQVAFRLCYNGSSTITTPGAGTTVGASKGVGITAVLNGTVNPIAQATIDESVTMGETAIDVTDGSIFTVGELIQFNDDSSGSGDLWEVVKITAIAGNTLTVTRAQQGTSAQEFDLSDSIYRYNVVEPTTDGDTIITFTEKTDQRYWAIETIPADGNMSASTDLEVGCYMVGNHYDMPVAPNLSVKHGFLSEGVKERITPGGKSIKFAHYLSANDTTDAYLPFRRQTYFRRMMGREFFDMQWQGVPDTNIYPQDLQSPDNSENFLSDVIRKIGINFLPFIFATDSDSSDEGDYMWSILNQKEFVTTQKAWQWVGFPLRIIQQF